MKGRVWGEVELREFQIQGRKGQAAERTAAKEAGVGKREEDRKEKEPLWQLYSVVCLQLPEESGAEEPGTKRQRVCENLQKPSGISVPQRAEDCENTNLKHQQRLSKEYKRRLEKDELETLLFLTSPIRILPRVWEHFHKAVCFSGRLFA